MFRQGSSLIIFLRSMTPVGLMLTTWFLYLVVIAIGPVHYHRSTSWLTYLLLIACVGGFVLGSRLAQNVCGSIRGRIYVPQLNATTRPGFNRAVSLFALLGLFGTACIAMDKVWINGLNVFQNLGALRLELNVDSGMPSQGTILMWIGMAVYSFSNVALILFFLEGEMCDHATARLAAMASFCPGVVILLYGGRSSAIFVILLMLTSGLVRVHCGRPFVPKTHFMRPMLLAHLSLVLLGSLHIFSSRAIAFGYSDSGDMLQEFSSHLNATISPTFQQLIASRSAIGELCANILMGVFYFTQGFPELDYLLIENSDAGPFYGSYQGWFLYRVVVELLGLPNELVEMEDQIHHSGLLFSAWGGMLLDFGPWGAPIASGLLGGIVGFMYDRGIRLRSVACRVFVAYFYMYIVLTPIHSAFAVGNSTQVLLCIIAASFVLQKALRPVPSPMFAGPLGRTVRPVRTPRPTVSPRR
jgi:hypothetical protein